MLRCFLAVLLMMSGSTFAHSQNAGQVLQDIIGGALGEFQKRQDRKQQEQQLKDIAPHWQSCSNGEIDACDRAAQFPLNGRAQRQLRQMRDDAVQRQAFLAQWAECFNNGDPQACTAALRYSRLTEVDRNSLLTKRDSIRREEAEARRQEIDRVRQEQDAAREVERQRREAEQVEAQRRRDEEHRRTIESARIARETAEANRRAEEAKAAERRHQLEIERIRQEQARLSRLRLEAMDKCRRQDEAACNFGIENSSDRAERDEFVRLLEVAQSPFGITWLKPLNKLIDVVRAVPWTEIILGAAAIAFIVLLGFLEKQYRTVSRSLGFLVGCLLSIGRRIGYALSQLKPSTSPSTLATATTAPTHSPVHSAKSTEYLAPETHATRAPEPVHRAMPEQISTPGPGLQAAQVGESMRYAAPPPLDMQTPASSSDGIKVGIVLACLLLGLIVGFLTRPSILGMQLPLEVLFSQHPSDAPFRNQLMVHLVIAGAGGLIVGAVLTFLVPKK